MEQVTFAGHVCNFRHTDVFVRPCAPGGLTPSRQIPPDMLVQTRSDAVTDALHNLPTQTNPSPRRELRGGVQVAGFREMIDEGVSSVSKSNFLP
jgi:hypothetical protein